MTQKPESRDPFLECLSYITALNGHSRSSESLKSGLAYDGHRVSLAILVEAAHRAGLNAKLAPFRKLADVTDQLIPAVIALKNKSAAVILKNDIKSGSVKIWRPETGKVETLKKNEFETMCLNELVGIKPKPEFVDPDLRQPKEFLAWFWEIIGENRALYRKALWASLLINVFALTSSVYIMNVYDRVIPHAAIETGWALAIGATIVFIFDFIVRTLRGYFIDFSGRNIDVRLTRILFERILDIRLSHRPASSGSFASMLKETESIRDFLASATIMTLVDLPFALLFLSVILMLAYPVGLAVLVMMLVSMGLSLVLQAPIKKYVAAATHTAETKHGLLVETIYGLETLKTLGADNRLRAKYAAHVSENAMAALKSRLYSALSVNLSLLVQQLTTVVIVIMGMYLVKDGQMSMGALIASVILSGRSLSPVTQLANMMSRLHHTRGAVRTLGKIMAAPQERPEGKEFLYRPELSGNIRFTDVTFAYPGTSHNVLDHINFSIKAGERVGIIGRIGSGKSTIAKVLLKLYDPDYGSVLVDDADYRQLDPSDLRRNMAYVAQDTTLFRGTIRENIAASVPNASEEDILRSARLSGADSFISTHPMGYGAQVGERGDGLSGGQKQCIALARALLLEPNVLICDEPTNAMDVQTEMNFIRVMKQRPETQTLILITHRANLLPLVDRLILIEGGRILMDDARDNVVKALQSGQFSGGTL